VWPRFKISFKMLAELIKKNFSIHIVIFDSLIKYFFALQNLILVVRSLRHYLNASGGSFKSSFKCVWPRFKASFKMLMELIKKKFRFMLSFLIHGIIFFISIHNVIFDSLELNIFLRFKPHIFVARF